MSLSKVNNFSVNTKIAGVIGDPIAQSQSPKIHNYLINKYQIDGIYLPFKIAPENLATTIQTFAQLGFRGFNVTLPHKENIFKICDHLSKTAQEVRAVNTVVITKDGKLFGHNSDGAGFIKNIQKNSDFDFKNKNIVMLGAGGASRAIYFALLEQGVKKITITNRGEEKAQILINDFKDKFKDCQLDFVDWNQRENALENCDLLINCTSLGMTGKEQLQINLQNLPKQALVTDIVYNPLITDLLSQAQNRGNKIVTGIGMLLYQALVGFELWYEIEPEVDDELLKALKI